MRHLLLTNDFPPKVGGIQSYLWELWRRLPADSFTVFTASSHREAGAWDAGQPFPVVRAREPVLLPNPHLARRVREQAARSHAQAVVIDPALPLGLMGASLGLPYAVVLHGAEVTVPGRLPVSRQLLARVVKGAGLVVAAGTYAEAEARRAAGTPRGGGFPPVAQVPPGVDTKRFVPLAPDRRRQARERWGLPPSAPVLLSTSRLVPRKGIDTLIEAAGALAARWPGLTVAVGSAGRDRGRLEKLAERSAARVVFLGRVSDEELPLLYGAADIFCLCCRSRWWGLEEEGFGIVLLEAAAAGLPCVTIDSGGAAEAVDDGVTGLVVRSGAPHGAIGVAPALRRGQVGEVVAAVGKLLDDRDLATRMGEAGRRRAQERFSYDILATRLAGALDEWQLG